MGNFSGRVIIFFLLLIHVHAGGQQVRINEIMSSNAATLADEDGDYSDWIELYNAGSETVQLAGWGLSDNGDLPYKWTFPEITLDAGKFLLVWASGKNRRPVKGELHTGFSISAQGEEVLLTLPGGVRADELPPVPLNRDISYGRTPDGTSFLKFFDLPTPGKPNTSKGYNGILTPPGFSHPGGFYSQNFAVTLYPAHEGVTILYTSDGSEPEIGNLTGSSYSYLNQYRQNPNTGAGPLLHRTMKSLTYTEPIPVRNRSSEADQISRISTTYDASPWYFPYGYTEKAVVVRARSFKEGALPSEVVSHTYFVREQGQNPYHLPVISLAACEDDLFDFYKGIYVAGTDFENWRSSNPTAKANGGTKANYHREGDEWEYPAHFEMFDSAGIRRLSQDVGFRIHGNWSNASPFKSLRIYARNEYGNDLLTFPFFRTIADSAFKRIILRNSGNDRWYTLFRDAALQEMVRHMNFETQAYQPSVLFINGEYWGIHNIRERYDKFYLSRRFGVNAEQVDILENNMTVSEGSKNHYAGMMDFISKNGMVIDSYYEWVATQIDVSSFIDYQIAQIFIVNTDWPGNNIKYWRLQTPDFLPEAGPGRDGRWRWMMYDTDYSFGIYTPTEYSKNMMTFSTLPNGTAWPNPAWSTLLFRRLLENEKFKTAFIVRFCDELNTAFLPQVVTSMINQIQSAIEPEMVRHIQRWRIPSSFSDWYNNVNQMRSFGELRPAYARNHLRDFFGLSADYMLTVDVSGSGQGYVKVNTIPLKNGTRGVADQPYPWKGSYFRNIPLRLEAVASPGYEFASWTSLNFSSTYPVLELKPEGHLNIKAIFRKSEQTVGIKPPVSQPTTRFYPNPFTDDAFLDLHLDKEGFVSIGIYSLSGYKISDMVKRSLAPGFYTFRVEGSLLSPGSYLLTCNTPAGTFRHKLVKR